MTRFDRIEAARLQRDPRDLTKHVPGVDEAKKGKGFTRHLRTDFAVGKLYDLDGRFEPTQYNLCREVAESVAGRMRDSSTDAEVKRQLDEGWTWTHLQLRGHLRAGMRRTSREKELAMKRGPLQNGGLSR